MNLRLIILFSTLLCLFAPREVSAQRIEESDTRAMMQANFIYQFATNCNWPAESRKGKFVIAVVGNPAVYEHLSEKYGNKPIGSQVIEIQQISEPAANGNYQILFIDKSKKAELAKALKDSKKNTLVVTNWEGALSSGAMINFKTIDGNIRYEMSMSNLVDRKITPGVKIIQWKVD
jgi:hypothetical protein